MTQKLKYEEARAIAANLPEEVRFLMGSTSPLFLAGGYIRDHIAGDAPKDIDLWGNDAETLIEAAENLGGAIGGHVRSTRNAITVRWRLSGEALSEDRVDDDAITVQFITRWLFDDPAKLIESFDFSVCQGALWYNGDDGWVGMVSDRFRDDIEARRLFYTAPDREEDCGHSLIRAFKMAKRGYGIAGEEIAKVVARLMRGVDVGFDFTLDEAAKDEIVLSGFLEPLLTTQRTY